MKVQENEVLTRLAAIANKEPKLLSLEIYDSLEMWGLLDHSVEGWGSPIDSSILDNTKVDLILCGLSIKPTVENKKAFLSLILMSGGDCPECGGNMQIDPDKTEYKHTYGDGYNAPPEYESVNEVYKCDHCGYIKR